MKKWLIIICLLLMPTVSLAYSMCAVKLSANGKKGWEYSSQDTIYGGLHNQISYDNHDSLYISEGNPFTRLSKSGKVLWESDLDAYYLTFTNEGQPLFLESFEILTKMDMDSSILWQRGFDRFAALDVYVDNDKNIIMIGYNIDDENGYAMYKCSANGEKVFSSSYHWLDYVLGAYYIMFVQDDEQMVVVGVYDDEGIDKYVNTFVALHDKDGNRIAINFYEDFQIISQALTSNNEIVLAGTGVMKVDFAGNVLWDYGRDDLQMVQILLDSEENIIGMGMDYDDSGWRDQIILFKLNPSGELVWRKTYERDYIETKKLLVDSEDNMIVAGFEGRTSGSIPIDTSYFALKLDPDGELLWHETYQPFEGKSAYASDAVLDDEDNIYIAGYSYDYTDGDDDDEPGCGCF